MATVMPGLRPATSGMSIASRGSGKPLSRNPTPLRASVDLVRRDSAASSAGGSSSLTANPKLSVIEVESLIRDKVRSNYESLQQAFQNYDIDQSLSITKGEFRRVLEAYCIPLTTEQFEQVMNKVDSNPNGTVRYCDFLDKFHGKSAPPGGRPQTEKWVSGTHKYIHTQSPRQMNTDMIEKMLREKIQKNFKNVLKGLRLYDYNRDGLIQKHELRKVLENYCFKMTDDQYEKFYQRHDFHHRGVLNYKDLLKKLGMGGSDPTNRHIPEGTKAAMDWDYNEDRFIQQEKMRLAALDKSGQVNLASMNLDQLEVEFRKKMRTNYVNLKKAFLAFDRNLDGFINLDDLKSVVRNFVMPLSDQLFSQLMDKFGIKASGKISWEFFLEKFQDPQAHGNGQTVPIKPNHKFFPIRGVDERMDLKTVIRLLHDHVNNAYASFKHAFLEIDKNRDGKISRKELKKVLDGFKFRMTDSQFKELMILLDPQHTNWISYHKFLDLFEERETGEGHKWLQSVHRFNENQKPAILAWNTVEDILKEKIEENWKDIANAIVRRDDRVEGKIYPKELRRIIEKFCLPISDEHFENLLGRCESQVNGKVNYTEFLVKLGVAVKPGDLIGLSTQITEGSEDREQIRLSDQANRQAHAELYAHERTDGMSPEEVLMRLKDRMAQHSPEIRKAFLKFDRSGKNKVTKKDFREMLESFGMYMTTKQFQELCSQLSFNGNHMTYSDFVANFEDPRAAGPAAELVKSPNHKWNAIRGDEVGMTAEQVELKFMAKLRENFEDLWGAFYKFDDDHKGNITKKNFRRILDTFMFNISDSEYERLCQRMGIDKKTKINYKEFLERFEVRDTEEGHPWLVSDHRFNTVQPTQPMTADEVHEVLKEKAHRQWKDLAKAFRTMDSSGNGIITRRELRETLYRFILPIEKEEFRKLWAKYDIENKGYISHKDFLHRLTGAQFAPGDEIGTSTQITHGSYKAVDQHHRNQQAIQEKITLNQADKSTKLSVDEVLQELKDRIREHYKDFYTAFTKYDTKKKGSLSVADIQKVLIDFNYFLDDDQFFELMERLGLSTAKSQLSYDKFLSAFEEGRKDGYEKKQPDIRASHFMAKHSLKPEEAVARINQMVEYQIDVMQAAFQSFDKANTGRVKVSDFRRILDNFCFKMTEPQFKHLLSQLTVHSDHTVDYSTYLDSYRPAAVDDTQKWLESMQRRLNTETPKLLTLEEINQQILELVASRFYTIAKAFAEIDYAKIGVLAKDDFRDVFHKYIFRLTDEQFEELWSSLKVNDFGNLDYRAFLKSYTDQIPEANSPDIQRRSHTPGLERRPQTSCSEYGRESVLRASLESRGGRPFTPLVNAETVESKVKDKIYRHWKDVQKQCRVFDTDGSGQINYEDISYILGRYDVEIPEEDMKKLAMKYDLKNNGRFCYPEFLRHFVLNMRPKEESLLARKKLQKPRVLVTVGEESEQYLDAMDRLQQCVMDNWKDMRRQFRNIDRTGNGIITPLEFRQILRDFNVNLTEDEFFHLMTYYDHQMNGKFSYNDFLRAYLKSS